MPEPLSIRIGHWMRFVDDPGIRQLLVECRDWLDKRGETELDARAVLRWFGDNGISLVGWQRQRFARDFELTPAEIEELCPPPSK